MINALINKENTSVKLVLISQIGAYQTLFTVNIMTEDFYANAGLQINPFLCVKTVASVLYFYASSNYVYYYCQMN